jgi:hypothetical protein
VLQIRGGTIRLGIEAPEEVSIRRAELADRRLPSVPPVTTALAAAQ